MVMAFDASSTRSPGLDVTAAFGVGLDRLLQRAVPRGHAMLRARAQTLDIEALAAPIHVYGDPDQLAKMIVRLIRFASCRGPEHAHVALSVLQVGEQARLRVCVSGTAPAQPARSRAAVPRWPSWNALQRAAVAHGVHLVRRPEASRDCVEYEMVFHALTVDGMASPLPGGLGSMRWAVPARRVLVVDDSADSADSVACLLALHGHEVQVAYDGAGALDKCANWRPHVLVLDIGLPDISGLDVAQMLKQCDAARGTVVIALSGYGVDDPHDRFDACLGKPVDPIVLLHTIDRLAGAGGATRPASIGARRSETRLRDTAS